MGTCWCACFAWNDSALFSISSAGTPLKRYLEYYKLQVFCNADLFSKRRRRFLFSQILRFSSNFLRKQGRFSLLRRQNLEICENKTFVSFPKRDAQSKIVGKDQQFCSNFDFNLKQQYDRSNLNFDFNLRKFKNHQFFRNFSKLSYNQYSELCCLALPQTF